jgi:tetratricopeptide (TPR) repeat protein
VTAYGYRAFISYSHADERWGRWLHRRLEAYRVPHKLVGNETGEGAVPPRLTPIFRDRDDLPAGSDLTQEVQAALRDSRFLVVICSPAAAQSKWVNQEILQFKRLHGEGRVLAAIVDGEPFAEDKPGQGFAECFPKALRHRLNDRGDLGEERTEPIAADFRPGGDGRKYGCSKLAAGLLGLKLDDLVRREAQRRNARLSALATVSLAIAAAMGVLAYATLLARDEAQRQRAEAVRARGDAEGLIEFMLTDLREKLDAVGRLDALAAVSQRALQYYGVQDLDRTDADTLGRRARTQMLIGEVDNLRGDLDAALRSYEQAAATTREQLERDPDNPQRLFDHAQSEFWVGYIAWQRGDLDQAERHMHAYHDYAQRLVTLEPDRAEWRTELGYAFSNLGTLTVERRNWAAALDWFEQSRRINEANVAEHPDDDAALLALGQDYSYAGETLAVLGRYDEAVASFQREIDLYDRLIEAAGAHQLAEARRIWAGYFLASIGLDRGELEAARQRLAALDASVRGQLSHSEDDTRLREAFVAVLRERSVAEAALGEHQRALELANAARDASGMLAAMDADNLLWQSYHAGALTTRARLPADGVRPWPEAAALSGFDAQRERTLDLAKRAPGSTFVVLAAAEAQLLAGDLVRGDPEIAAEHWRRGLDVLPAAAEQRTPDEQFVAFALLQRLGRTNEARAAAGRLDAIGYRHPAFLQEREAVPVSGLRRPSDRPLRGRPPSVVDAGFS